MRQRSFGRWVVRVLVVALLGASLGACGGGGGPAPAGPPLPPPLPPLPFVDPQYLASAASPFAPGCDGQAATGTLYVNAEVEPYLAVNPANANHMIGVWQQDRWSDGSARGMIAAVSRDGGLSWSRQALPVSRCGGGTVANGGDYARATDPWVTFSPNGVAYAMALVTNGGSFQPGSANAMLVSRSLDGGTTWDAPATLIREGAGFFNDKNALTADPLDPSLVYAVWDRLVAGTPNGPTYFARTTDAGASWEPARAIYDPGPSSQTIGNVIAVLPGGTLVNVFTQLDAVTGGRDASIAVIRSFDRGLTWTSPVRIADALAIGVRDPDTGAPVRDGALLPQVAVDRAGGAVYVVWQDARFSAGAIDGMVLSRSNDNGASWSGPSRVNTSATTAQAFTPSVHVLADGTLGVSYYDFRANTADPGALQTEYWLARSRDGGASWTETRIANAFDLDNAPNAGGYFLGDYQALASRGNVFVPFFVRTGADLANRTDVYAAPAVSAVVAVEAAHGIRAESGQAVAEPTPQWRARARAAAASALQARLIAQPRPASPQPP